MPTITVRVNQHDILNLLVSHQLVASRSEARLIVEQGGVRVDQVPITSWEDSVKLKNGSVVQVGKRRFVKITIS